VIDFFNMDPDGDWLNGYVCHFLDTVDVHFPTSIAVTICILPSSHPWPVPRSLLTTPTHYTVLLEFQDPNVEAKRIKPHLDKCVFYSIFVYLCYRLQTTLNLGKWHAFGILYNTVSGSPSTCES
jgi:hypothetical protein